MEAIHVGARFYSYECLDLAIKNFGEENNIIFWKRDAKRLDIVRQIRRVADAPSELKYYSVRYTCIGGGRPHRSRCTTGKRKVKTFKQGCPVFIKVLLSKDSKSLEINEMKLEHNHLLSRELYESLPRVRRLSSVWQERVRNCMNLKVKKKLVLQAVIEETGKQVTLKDLHNIRNRYRRLDQQMNEESLQMSTMQNVSNEIYPYAFKGAVASVESDPILEQVMHKTPTVITICKTECEDDMPQMSSDSQVCSTQSENDVPETPSNSRIENAETTNIPQISKATLNGPRMFLPLLNQPTKATSDFHSPSEKGTCLQTENNSQSTKRKFMEDETVQKLVDNQQETNREIKIMNNHLAEIVHILKRIETRLSKNVDV